MPDYVMTQQITKVGGEVVDIPLIGDRFKTSELPLGRITMKFDSFNGWKILELLVPTILYYRPYCVVEIGAGESTKILAFAAEQAGVKFHSCDKSPRKNIKYFHDHIFHQVFSDDFMGYFNDSPAVVLIDADHHYEQAKKEFDFFFEKLVPGGVIFIHDTFPPSEDFLSMTACGDVYRLRQELELRTDEMDCFTWPYTTNYMGLTQIIKKDPNRPYWGK